MKSKQEALLAFFRQHPLLSVFVHAFNYNKAPGYAAVGIVLLADKEGRWQTNWDEIITLMRSDGRKAREKFEADYIPYRQEFCRCDVYECRRKFFGKIYEWFAKKPSVREEPMEHPLVAFSNQNTIVISDGLEALAKDGYIDKQPFAVEGKVIPTSKFFEVLLGQYSCFTIECQEEQGQLATQ